MNLIILLAALVAAGHCAKLGGDRTTYGPSYCCGNLKQAIECGTTEFCLTNTWKNQIRDMPGSTEPCFESINAIEAVRSHLEKPKDELLNQMAVVCTGVPDHERQMCKELVLTHQGEILRLLKSDLPTRHLPAILGFCGKLKYHVETIEEDEVNSDYCTDCKNFFGDIQEIFKNEQNEVVALVKEQICSKLGPFADTCNELVDEYAAIAFNFIFQQLDPTNVCTLIGFCSSDAPVAVQRYGKVGSNDTCTNCKNFAEDVQKVLEDPKVQQQILTAAEDLCDELPASLADQCKTYVTSYGPFVLELLAAELNPDELCSLIGFCKTQSVDQITQKVAKVAQMSGLCDACHTIAQDLQSLLQNKDVQNDIMNALEDICTRLAGSFADQCKAYVAEYFPVIVEILISELDPTTLCQDLGLCSGTRNGNKLTVVPLGPPDGLVHILHHQPVQPAGSAVSVGPQCALCEFIMKELANMIDSSSTEEDIKNALDRVCSLLPSTLKDQCDAFVNEYASLILELLKDKAPAAVCTALQLCAGNKAEPVALQARTFKLQVPVDEEVQCEICKTAIGYIESELSQPGNEKSVEELLKGFCDIFPTEYQQTCSDLIAAYYPSLINMLMQYESPDKICTELTLCKAKSSHPLKFKPMVDLVPAKPHLLGGKKCLWGPSYWCSSRQAAQECNAMDHCLKHGLTNNFN